MSDAFTEITKDVSAANSIEKLFYLKDKFAANPSPILADDILTQLTEVNSLPKGYFFSSDPTEISKEIEKYQKFIFYEID